MSDVLRFGLIGCGRVAPRHAESLLSLPGAQLVAVADVREYTGGAVCCPVSCGCPHRLPCALSAARCGCGQHLHAQRPPRADGG